jgi:hypothetical protein
MLVRAAPHPALAGLALWFGLSGVAFADIVGAPPNVTPPPPNVTPAPPNVMPSPLILRPSTSRRRVRDCRLYSETDKFGRMRIVRRCR